MDPFRQPHPALLHGLIEQQAQGVPQQVALTHGSTAITFEELNARANQLARALLTAGVGPGALVAANMPKSIDLVITALSVLKCGAVFVPVDHRYPHERRQAILADERMHACIVGEPDELPQGRKSINGGFLLSELKARALGLSSNNLDLPLAPGSLAWVFHTSGSTSRPKAVMGTHYNSVMRCLCMADMQPMGADEICAQQMPLGSIDWVWETFAPLGFGLPVVLIDTLELASPGRMVEALADYRITQLCLVPSHLNLVLESCPDLSLRLPHLKTWISTGEPLTQRLAKRFQCALPQATLLNQYGLTETIATSSCFTIPVGADAGPGTLVPIGYPLRAAAIHVLDSDLTEPPAGAVGELFLGGDCLASGYFGEPALTAERFVPDPTGCGARVYRSGDLARRGVNGCIEYCGRLDRQIKVLGYRVETFEVEAALMRIPGVSQAAVVGVESERVELAAFVVWGGANACEEELVSRLLRELTATLPGYMVPAALAILAVMPTTPNGKVDYRALAAEHRLRLGVKPNSGPPAAARVVEALENAWVRVLGAPASADCDFFDSGGDSVSAIRLSKHVGDELRISVPIATIYRYPRLQDLAAALAHQGSISG